MADRIAPQLVIWRHPKPVGAAGRCIGRTDLAVDHRRAKRLAHRIRAAARRHGWPRLIVTSPLRRGRAVGRWLRRWGWRHEVDARLLEMDFGAWDGRPWEQLGPEQFAAWDLDFCGHAPGGGESVTQLRQRVETFLADLPASDAPADDAPRLCVGHAGWINALAVRHIQSPSAREWPLPLRYGECLQVSLDGTTATMRPSLPRQALPAFRRSTT